MTDFIPADLFMPGEERYIVHVKLQDADYNTTVCKSVTLAVALAYATDWMRKLYNIEETVTVKDMKTLHTIFTFTVRPKN